MFPKDYSHHFLNKKVLSHLLFWLIMLIYYMSSSWPFELNKVFLFERMFFKVIVQIILSYVIIYLLVPILLNKKRPVLFGISLLLWVYLMYALYTAIRCYYLVPKYPEIFEFRPPLEFFERITNAYAYLGNITGLIFPTVIIMMFDYFRHQKDVLKLKEQKRITELNLLKNQLNPHFLFNTLNNLYTLALKKSDRTPEAIAKLSDILDYMLYQCKENFVPLKSEVDLINNYIELEKIRYGKRLHITFNHSISDDVKIAPLLLLTFVENAFKHGVSQEINLATIQISLQANDTEFFFKIDNSKPELEAKRNSKQRDSIGLQNIIKQLEILYPNKYALDTTNEVKSFSLSLKLNTNGL